MAVATTIATTYTSRYVGSHPGVNALSGSALTHGFQITFYVLAALAALAAVLAAAMIESQPSEAEAAELGELAPAPEEAA